MREKKPDNLGTLAECMKSTCLYYWPKQQLRRGVVTRFLSHYFVKLIQEGFRWKRLKKEKLRHVRVSRIEDRVESFEFRVTVTWHLTGTVEQYEINLCCTCTVSTCKQDSKLNQMSGHKFVTSHENLVATLKILAMKLIVAI